MTNNRKVLSIFTVLFISMLFSTMIQADPKANPAKSGKSNSGTKTHKVDSGIDADLSVMISAGISIGDARKLASNYKLTGGKPLPPGIRKNMARGKPIPPGIQKTRLPNAFIDQLPRHAGYEWRQTGTDLVLVVSGSLVISDILEGVFD